jgi:hypothetical protein
MKLEDYLSTFGFMDKATIYLEGEYIPYYDLREEMPDLEIDDIQAELLDRDDVFGLIHLLKLEIPAKEIVTLLRESLDNYRSSGGDALHWLYKAFNQVRLNPGNCNPLNIGTVENHLLAWIESFEKYPFDILRAQNEDEDKRYRDATLGDLFVVKSDLKKCVEMLRGGKINVIDKKNRFILGERQKGAIVAWVDVLQERGKLRKDVNRETLAYLLNEYFTNLNISGRTLSNPTTTAARKYRPLLLALIK